LTGVDQQPSARQYLLLLLGLVVTFQGLALVITSNKLVATYWWMRLFGLAMAVGGLYFIYRYLPREVLARPIDEDAKARAARDMVMRLARGQRGPETTLARRFIDVVTLGGRLVPLFPVFGIAVIVADLAWNLVLTGSTEFLTYDWLALLVGGYLVAYRWVPADYQREREFAFVFLLSLSLLLLVPVLVERAAEGNAASSRGISAYSEYLLAKPVEWMLGAAGVTSSIDGVTITFLTVDGDPISLLIATSCSGVYSFAIFSSAFLAFVGTEFTRWDPRLKWFLVLGITAAYLANLIRMFIIVMAGYYRGPDALKWAHANVGWLIYMAWIALFWWLLFRWFFSQRAEGTDRGDDASPSV
jgi:archaeosortase C (PEF-CTERM variant)